MKSRFAALLIALFCLGLWPCNQVLAKEKKKADPATIVEPKFTVRSPLGIPPAIKLLAMAPRLNTLDGKTIYIVDDGFVGGDVLLKEMAAWFTRNMPSVNAVYRRKAGGFPDDDPALWAEIKAKGDAVIMGVGH
jgi:type IV secretory pathway TrbD component